MLYAKSFRRNKEIVSPVSRMKSFVFALLPLWVIFSSFCFGSEETSSFQSHYPHAKPERDSAELSKQRRLFTDALKSIKVKNWEKLRNIQKDLVHYPLYPYLRYSDLVANLSIPQRRDISNFLETYPDSVLAQRLRSKWLNYLANQKQWAMYLDYYEEANANAARKCHYYYAKLKHTDSKELIDDALKLWTVGHSQPKACDDLFNTLSGLRLINDAHAWLRFKKALVQNNLSLARYAKGFMTDKSTITRANSYHAMHRQPHKLNILIDDLYEHAEDIDIFSHYLRRLASKDPSKAMKYWHQVKSGPEMPQHEVALFITIIVKTLTKRGEIDTADQYLTEYSPLINEHLEGDVIEWRIRQAIKKQNWTKVLHWIAFLDLPKQNSNVWRYWQIRSLEASKSKDTAQLLRRSKQLAKERDFYGFLISDQLSQPYQFNHTPIIIDNRDLMRIKSLPAIQRAREFFFHGQNIHANREWTAATRNINRTEWIALGFLSSKWGWHSRAIMSMAQARYWDDLNIRFPFAFLSVIQTAARQSDTEIHTLLAIARQESAFDHQAISRAGAIGLMQIMPATAQATAKLHNIPFKNKAHLQDKDINSTIGATYYAGLLERFKENKILAMAAYNAGPERVSKWLSQSSGKQPFDVWIETIPFQETRHYVMNVLTYSAIYSYLLGARNSMLTAHERNYLF
jgi:soluble lytic murein transglycosylase